MKVRIPSIRLTGAEGELEEVRPIIEWKDDSDPNPRRELYIHCLDKPEKLTLKTALERRMK